MAFLIVLSDSAEFGSGGSSNELVNSWASQKIWTRLLTTSFERPVTLSNPRLIAYLSPSLPLQNNVVELSDVEKVYLYLNLPTGTQETENSKLYVLRSNCSPATDSRRLNRNQNWFINPSSNSFGHKLKCRFFPIASRGPGNPFGKKADIEVSQTYIWIQSHLEEDSTESLPKVRSPIAMRQNLIRKLLIQNLATNAPFVQPTGRGLRGIQNFLWI